MIPKKEIRVQWTHSSNGFMDFIRGVITLYQIFGEEYKITPVISPKIKLSEIFEYSNSHLYKTICQKEDYYDNDPLVIRDIVGQQLNEDIIYLAKCYFTPDWDVDFSKYKWLLAVKPEFEKLVSKYKLPDYDYSLIYVRCSDELMKNQREATKHLTNHYRDIINGIIKDKINTYPPILLSTYLDVRKHFYSIVAADTIPYHSSRPTMSDNDVVDWIFDLKLICNAKQVISIFTNSGYGFTTIPCKIFNIPHTKIMKNVQSKQEQVLNTCKFTREIFASSEDYIAAFARNDSKY